MNMTDMVNFPASAVIGFKPVKSGGEVRWYNGSAVPQKRIPVAIVVHKTMVNQRHLVRIGLAPCPPIRTFLNGLIRAITHRINMERVTRLNASPKTFNIHELMPVINSWKRSGSARLNTRATKSSRKGGQKT